VARPGRRLSADRHSGPAVRPVRGPL
jgi:hypothetical protein